MCGGDMSRQTLSLTFYLIGGSLNPSHKVDAV